MKSKVFTIVSLGFVGASLGLFCPDAAAQPFTVTNGHFNGDTTGWSGYQGTVSYQTINSPTDGFDMTGSGLLTSTLLNCSISQNIGITASGQTLHVSADIVWDGSWDFISFGFYDFSIYEIFDGCYVDVTTLVAPDTDGTLDNFTKVTVSGTLPNNGNQVGVIFCTSCNPYGGGAQNPGTSAFAVDNVQAELSPVGKWKEY